MAESMTSTFAATAQRALARAPVPPSEPISGKESTQAERAIIGESTPTPTKISTPQKRVTPAGCPRLRPSLLLLLLLYLLVILSLPSLKL